MSFDSRPTSTEPPPAIDRLESWKEISAYLRRGVTTVQRWEREEGLPVHRHDHAKRGSVFAFRSELDAWRTSRTRVAEQSLDGGESDATAESARFGGTMGDLARPAAVALARRPLVWTAVVLVVAAAGATFVFSARRWHVDSGPTTHPRTLAHGSFPALSPDGSQVAYMVLPELYVRPITGGAARKLLKTAHAHANDVDLYPAWSPEGRRIAFLREVRPWVHDLYVVDLETHLERRLTQVYGHDVDWSPDGTSLLVPDRHPNEDPFSIFLISATTGERLKRLTTPPAGTFGDTACAISPDGTQLAVERYVTQQEADIHVVPLNGAGARRITHDGQPFSGLTWTPDGESIVAASYRDGDLRLWRISPTGENDPVVVPGTDRGARHPTFSRRGSSEVLAYTHQPMDDDIWRWEAREPGTPGAVIASSPRDDGPAVSPDGRRLAFLSSRTGLREIWLANADGTHPRQLTLLKGPQPFSPRWSPDGSRLAFTWTAHFNRDIYIVDADGGGLRRLTFDHSDEENPSWSADGRWIHFRSDRTGISQIWKIPAAGGTPTLVTAGEASEARESLDGSRLYFVRGRLTTGLWTISTRGGPETFVAPEVQEGYWDLASDGVYYIRRTGGLNEIQIKHLDLETRRATVLRSFTLPGVRHVGFSASANGRWVFWVQRTLANPSMKIVDAWR